MVPFEDQNFQRDNVVLRMLFMSILTGIQCRCHNATEASDYDLVVLLAFLVVCDHLLFSIFQRDTFTRQPLLVTAPFY